jgi:aquaporin Z
MAVIRSMTEDDSNARAGAEAAAILEKSPSRRTYAHGARGDPWLGREMSRAQGRREWADETRIAVQHPKIRSRRHPVTRALRSNWPEYLMEAAELAAFMLAACVGTVVLEHPASVVRRGLPDPLVRRALAGLAMGLTAIAIVYSPWGRRSGAHFNPCVTLTFYRLGRVPGWDATFYVLAQFAGGAAGVATASLLLGAAAADPAVAFAVTVPGPAGTSAALIAELVISFGLMLAVLVLAGSRFAGATGVVAGSLVATYITIEAPLSGMSMNPARTVASALFAHDWRALWLYFLAPAAGMLLAAEGYLRITRRRPRGCAKLCHDESYRCIFCARAADAARA